MPLYVLFVIATEAWQSWPRRDCFVAMLLATTEGERLLRLTNASLAMTRRECHCEHLKGAWQSSVNRRSSEVVSSPYYRHANQGAREHHYCDYDKNECP